MWRKTYLLDSKPFFFFCFFLFLNIIFSRQGDIDWKLVQVNIGNLDDFSRIIYYCTHILKTLLHVTDIGTVMRNGPFTELTRIKYPHL